ncbi:MAG: heparinase II/III family protein [Rickettsiales bacterium]|nr:heparinase II/III family protein [Rickettsiales bacterium]
MSPLLQLRFAWLWLTAGQPSITRALRGHDSPTNTRWPNNNIMGKKLLKRRFVFAGCDVEMAGRIAWHVESANEAWHRDLYSFRWLEDIASTSNPKVAASFAREFINSFILEKQDLLPSAFAMQTLGIRVAEWLYYRRFLMKSGSIRFQRRLIRSLITDIRYMQRYLANAEPPDALMMIKGLIAASISLPMLHLDRRAYCEQLENILDELILNDGMHVSRNPEEHLHILRHLIEMRDMLLLIGEESLGLDAHIMAMGSSLRFFCHGDGRLGLFNGALMEEPHLIAQTISRSDNGEPVPAHMDASGFFRLERGHACILMCGQPHRPLALSAPSMGSFEFSDGLERFIVNCGGYRGTSTTWQAASVMPAAHTTLSLEARTLPIGSVPQRPYQLTDDELPTIKPDAFLNDGSQHIARTSRMVSIAQADGMHERELRLNVSGQQFSGMDVFRLLRAQSDGELKLNLRFHLHPDIRCQRQKDGTISLSSVGGSVWYFTSTMPKATQIEESVYLGYYGKPQKTLQIVISTDITTKVTEFRWSLTRQVEAL